MTTPTLGHADHPLRWRRVHPVTPLVRGWSVIAVLLVIFARENLDNLPNEDAAQLAGAWWKVLLGIVAVGLIVFAYMALAWRMTTFAVDSESVRLHTGVVFRQQRRARLDRLQAVDIVQPLVARMFALAELKLEVAGGSGSAVRLGYLKLEDAQHLRNELLALAAGVKLAERSAAAGVPATGVLGAGVSAAEVPGTGVSADPASDPASAHPLVAGPLVPGPVTADLGALEAPEQPVTQLSTGRLIGSIAASGAAVVFVVGIIAAGAVAAVSGGFGAVLAILPFLLGTGGVVFSRFTREFAFRSAISPDGIRLRHGLLETRSQTIPPGRVQAIRISQSPLWRKPGWWRVTVNVAGYSNTGDGTENTNLLLPVGTQSEALDALWLVLPDLGAPDPLAVCAEGLTGLDAGQYFTTQPRRSRWLDLVSWRRNGFAVTDRALLIRGGRIWRYLAVVPHERTQSLGLVQGPLQRSFGVATFAVHSTPGPISPTVPHLDAADATALLEVQAARAREARAKAGPERWMDPHNTGGVSRGL